MDNAKVNVSVRLEPLLESHTKFLNFLAARIADRAAAEDILQSAYVKAMEGGGELRQSESIVAWFYRILRNSVVDYYRRNASQQTAFQKFAAELPAFYEEELKDRSCACVREMLPALKPEYREAIDQIDLAEEPIESFAAKQGITLNNATVRLHRARRALANKLAETCGVCAEHRCIDCTCRHT